MRDYNIIEILQEFELPPSFKLYTPIVGEVYFLSIAEDVITVLTEDGDSLCFNSKGQYIFNNEKAAGEMLLFPDEYLRDWYCFSTLLVMRTAKPGDYISLWEDNKPTAIGIFEKFDYKKFTEEIIVYCYAGINFGNEFIKNKTLSARKITFATEEAKKDLNKEIYEHGYLWDNYNKEIKIAKYDWKTALSGSDYIPVIVLSGHEWIVNKLIRIEPNTQLPFTCIDNKKYRYCMPYCNRTYEVVYTDKEVDPIYDISIK
jgi:hypothetical protein